ncbi:nudC domain-containing protein 3 [Prorops nasuta]|uniref:nudC domain-containing protein 3 n=1 Tax=Prorops nasuta TaxID=863751 RepID=UPI0034D018F2
MTLERDGMFLEILREEKNVSNFLDAFFGFLSRCTDFYIESDGQQNLGFPPGLAEKLVINTFHKWKKQYAITTCTSDDRRSFAEKSEQMGESTFSTSSLEAQISTLDKLKLNIDTASAAPSDRKDTKFVFQSSDSYNGAVRDNYSWSQTITDIDVVIKVPEYVKTGKDLKVNLSSHEIKIYARTIANAEQNDNESSIIFHGVLSHTVRKDESVWSLIPGKSVTIHLEKVTERWWDALIVGEDKIELNKINCTRNLDEMDPAEQMKVQELMWNHQQKLMGKATSEQIRMEQVLKKAWDKDGSPFKGTPYDPSVLKFN